jgi:DNA polymerase
MMLYLDFETFSEVDITRVGTHFYAAHPSTEALMLAYAFDDKPVKIWNIARGEELPFQIEHYITSPSAAVSAFNATFERLILKHCLGIDIPASRFRCTMVRAYALAFTKGLDDVLYQFNQDVAKDPRGKALINRFSKPQPGNQTVSRWTAENDPEGYAEFMKYCKQDVEAERQLQKALECYPWPAVEQELYVLDQKINDRGVPVDVKLLDAAIKINDLAKTDLLAEMKDLTGLDNPNSNQQLNGWFKTQGLELPNMQKDTITAAIEGLEVLL